MTLGRLHAQTHEQRRQHGKDVGLEECNEKLQQHDAKDEADADRLFSALSSGGKVTLPLTKTFFSPRFGMLADKFGVNWMIIVEPK